MSFNVRSRTEEPSRPGRVASDYLVSAGCYARMREAVQKGYRQPSHSLVVTTISGSVSLPGVPGVIVEPGQDLGSGPVGERVPVEVGLPALVRLLGLEPDAGGSRPLAGLGDDEAAGGQVPADRRRGHGDAVVVFQVPADRVRPASMPCSASSLRSRMIRSALSPLIADSEVLGRRDLGSNAASPSAWYRAGSAQTQDRATPYSRRDNAGPAAGSLKINS